MVLDQKHSGKDLIALVNRWDPGTKATSTFLNDCAASGDFIWAPPEQGSGKWKKYNDIHLLEFGIQCAIKAMSLPRKTSKLIVKEMRKETSYHKAQSKKELQERLESYMLIIKNSKNFESVWDFDAMKKAFEGGPGIMTAKSSDTKSPISHALILVPGVIFKRLVE